ncbi:MAG: DUF1987 domain-containing protein [Bacteroidetes bacterium]|nr:DUF1987 domain-containing protein [Bacteroidota bacterium]
MEPLYREKTQDSPDVILDKEKNKFYIGGRSLSENPVEFFRPIVKWFEKYAEDPNETTQLEFKLEYFNSSSARIIANILGKFENLKKTGKDVEILWNYKINDKDMLEAGQRFGEAFVLPFKFIPY